MDFYRPEIGEFVLSSLAGIWNYLGTIFTSFTSPTVIAAIIAPWAAVTTFLRQQRISRVQRIYYEESLLDQLNHLDKAFNITNQNYAYFENVANLIFNDFNIHSLFNINNQFTIVSLRDIANKITSPVMYQSSKKEIIITLFKERGYVVYRWLSKFDNDFRTFNLYVKEVISGLIVKLESNLENRLELNINGRLAEITNLYTLLMRHQTLVYLFNQIVTRIGVLDFKSREALINNVEKDKEINNSLKKFDEVFKILFGYFKVENNVLISYLMDELGNRFKLKVDDSISIEKIKFEANLADKEIKIVFNDIKLSGSKVNINGKLRSYPLVQTGIANLFAFYEKPKFYSEVRSFNHVFENNKSKNDDK